jgi:type I restriction enzyme R subunit
VSCRCATRPSTSPPTGASSTTSTPPNRPHRHPSQRHTTDIFGRPVYTYSYREAVADDWLIDHEPPIRYETLLSQHGIHFDKGEQVERHRSRHRRNRAIAELDDELQFELESFNRRVINEDFNRVICEQLVEEAGPVQRRKDHDLLRHRRCMPTWSSACSTPPSRLYGDEYNEAAVAKITGASDKIDQLIRRYKNERYPSIAITVDLLTTGIDVPPSATSSSCAGCVRASSTNR